MSSRNCHNNYRQTIMVYEIWKQWRCEIIKYNINYTFFTATLIMLRYDLSLKSKLMIRYNMNFLFKLDS